MLKVKYLLLIICLTSTFISCQKDTFLNLSTPETISFSDQGGNQVLSFNTNKAWTASSSESWCIINPTSGEAAENGVSVNLSCESNTSYDDRSCLVTLRVGDISKTITVNQESKKGIIASPKSFSLSNKEQIINLEVQANVDYSIVIDPSCTDWIEQIETRSLQSKVHTFAITQNTTFDNREGYITLKQNNGNLSETIIVKQSQKNSLLVSTPEYELSNEQQKISVEVASNVEYEVVPNVTWISFIETKSITTSSFTLEIAANDDYDTRVGTVSVKQKNGDLEEIITIRQDQNSGLFVSPQDLLVDNKSSEVTIEVLHNVDYTVIIPPEGEGWISPVERARSLQSDVVSFKISENKTYKQREATLTVKQIDGPLCGTVTIRQKQTDHLEVLQDLMTVSFNEDSTVFTILSNVQHSFYLGGIDWISIIPVEDYKTEDGLTHASYKAHISRNPKTHKRQAEIHVKDSTGVIDKTFTIEQKPDILITFDDPKVLSKCVEAWDLNGDGELSQGEAFIVKDLGDIFVESDIESFDELRYFKNLKSISDGCFQYCLKLLSVIIPEGVKSIGQSAFRSCWAIKSIVIPDSVESFGIRAFEYCYKLESIHIPSKITSIENGTFNCCGSIKEFELPQTVTSIDEMAFHSCSSLEEIIIPENVNFIGEFAFASCLKLQYVVLRPQTPPRITNRENIFRYFGGYFYVPKQSLSAYKNDEFWRSYAERIRAF